MNEIVATISQIDNIDNLNIVQFEFNNQTLKMMSLDLNDNIVKNQKVILTVKPTHIAIGKNFSGELSYSNQIKATIDDIEKGELLVNVISKVAGINLQSIITASSANRMNLKKEDEIILLIKASDISILDVIND
ncbi:MAG: TOBE domain-containing protein [Halarcobacter sp.]